jgi:hypothetical protein
MTADGSTALGERLAWYAARARAMSPAEVAWRAGNRLSGALGRRRSRPLLDPGQTWEHAYHRFQIGTGRPVLLDQHLATELAAALPAEAAAVTAAADAVREHRFGFFGQDPATFPGREIDWNLDPRTGQRWPSAPAAGIDHRTVDGDPKWIWELNRLQHLPWLAQAWLFTGERGYADAALEQLDGWVRQNPPGLGIAWRGGFEAGVRAISVAVAVQGLRTAPGMTVPRYRRALGLLAACAQRAWRERSRFSSANNHLLGEMSGVATTAILFPELGGSARAEARALRVLADEAARQIRPDGSGAEQSVAYQIFATELLMVPAALLRLRGDHVPAPILDALRRGADYLRELGAPLPRYGDEDGGFALRLHADPAPGLDRHLAAVGAVTTANAAADVAACWLAGRVPSSAGTAAATPLAPARDRYFADGGLVVLRCGDRRLTMDVGPLGYLSLAAHGHADALALTLTDGDATLIDDPGTGSYYAEPAFRDAFRGTRSHGTVTVDDVDQSVSGGAFLWTRHAVTTVRTVDLERGLVEAEHDGYTRLAEPVTHRRYLLAPPDQRAVAVIDLLTGVGAHRIRTSWPLAPDLDVRTDGAAHVADRSGRPVLRITTAATGPARGWALRGDEQQRLGWWSGWFESRAPAWLVGSVLEDAALPLAVLTVLTSGDEVTEARVQLRDGQLEAGWASPCGTARIQIDTRRAGAVRTQYSTRTAGEN